jgi:hypothetical protein
MRLDNLLRRVTTSFHSTRQLGLGVCVFAAAYLLAMSYVRGVTSRDPGSWFFNPRTAYDPRYSTVRSYQAESFVVTADTAVPFHRSRHSEEPLHLCVGIPSIAREGVHYLRTTVGSLLEGLTPRERDGIHLIVFIPHSDPESHPSYHEPWLANLADEILQYNISKEQFEHIVEMEQEQALFREKGLYDYTYLLKACHATSAPYIAIFEDDVIAMDGWYHRTLSAINEADKECLRNNREISDFLYLRLFYTEEFLGWNGEDWQIHLFWSIATVVASGLILSWIRFCSPSMKRLLTTQATLAICIFAVPSLVVLFFAAGRTSVLPLPFGVNVMNKYGCCSQGFVFPRHKAENLIAWYEQAHVGFVDMLTEQYADEHNELRLAVTPSVIQHIGRKSSKGDDFGKNSKHHLSVAQKLWNFDFELLDKDELRAEHEAVASR